MTSRMLPRAVAAEIQAKKSDFLFYNISRIRELIRYLPPQKMELFDSIPFLLHHHLPGLPGYSKDPETPRGIYRFERSGFLKRGLKRFPVEIAKSREPEAGEAPIHGVYLMGSAGTIAQTDFSDFDYWILIDKTSLDEQKLASLKKKLLDIEAWSLRTYAHSVKFFCLDIVDLRNNNFSEADTESSGSAQKTLLKEEFYRTFIRIAGRIPFWSVFPVSLTGDEYRTWVGSAAADSTIEANDFIDLGNLSGVNEAECLGALLWQMYKARTDPVKSLIKASLIAHYCFFARQEPLLCDRVKKRFSERQLDSYRIDPYTAVFETVVAFYEKMRDEAGLDLIKGCVLLRLLGYPFASDALVGSPKRELLDRFVRQWGIENKTRAELESYPEWTEQRKRAFDDRLFEKLTDLYELVLRSRGREDRPFEMVRSDLKTLSTRITIWFQRKADKLPRCSTWLRSTPRALPLSVSCIPDRTESPVWQVLNGPEIRTSDASPIFFSSELLRVIGWIYFNGFYRKPDFPVVFLPTRCGISHIHAKRLFADTCLFLSEKPPDPAGTGEWTRLVLFANAAGPGKKKLASADLLIQNDLEELYFKTLDLAGVENHLLQCYSISTEMWGYIKTTPASNLQYRIVEIGSESLPNTSGAVENFLVRLKNGSLRAGPNRLETSRRRAEERIGS